MQVTVHFLSDSLWQLKFLNNTSTSVQTHGAINVYPLLAITTKVIQNCQGHEWNERFSNT